MAKRRTRKSTPRGQRQTDGAPPIIEDASLPRMGEAPPTDTKSRRSWPNPRAGHRKAKPHAAGSKDRRRSRPATGTRLSRPGAASPIAVVEGRRDERRRRVPAIARARRTRQALAGRRHGRRWATRAVDELYPGLAYEVTVGSRRVAVGQVQDAGVLRSFGDPSGRPALSGHHFTVLPRYQIAVRVPLTGLSQAMLRRANLTVYRWHGAAAETHGERSVKPRLGKRVETIGRLKGIRIDSLPKAASARLKAALTRRS